MTLLLTIWCLYSTVIKSGWGGVDTEYTPVHNHLRFIFHET